MIYLASPAQSHQFKGIFLCPMAIVMCNRHFKYGTCEDDVEAFSF